MQVNFSMGSKIEGGFSYYTQQLKNFKRVNFLKNKVGY